MAKETYIQIRCTNEFKSQIELLAKKENRTVSNYIENLLKNEIEEDNESMKNLVYMDLEGILNLNGEFLNDKELDELQENENVTGFESLGACGRFSGNVEWFDVQIKNGERIDVYYKPEICNDLR
jgi:hypothetical protein